MKRFYKETAVDAGDGGYRVLLDGKPMRTPAKAVLVAPTRALAEAIAAEWHEVPDKAEINVSHLRLTRLAASRRQCLRRRGAAGRSPAAGLARTAAGARRGRRAPALGAAAEPESDCETRPPALSLPLVAGLARRVSPRQ